MFEIRKHYHEQLEELKTGTIRLAAMATEAITAGTQALLDGDLSAAERVIAGDHRLDELTRTIEEQTYLVLACQSPMASELRALVATLRVVHELERCGDLMVNVAKATRRLHPRGLDPKARGLLEQMGAQAADQLRLAMDAFQDADVLKAAALVDMDDVMDDLEKALFRAIFSAGAADEAALQRAVQVALVGRFYERIADHAVNVGSRVRFMVTGVWPGHEDEAEEEEGPVSRTGP
ncbi:MAG: phosphate signaling complex protein PhoU [Actinomycetota bacterium]|nr:phosphate signaling complex protein PhoU [Actinomycetota bacterium]